MTLRLDYGKIPASVVGSMDGTYAYLDGALINQVLRGAGCNWKH